MLSGDGRPLSLPVAVDVIVAPFGIVKVVLPPSTMFSARCLSAVRRHTLEAAVSPRGRCSTMVGLIMWCGIAGKIKLFRCLPLIAAQSFLTIRARQAFPTKPLMVHGFFAFTIACVYLDVLFSITLHLKPWWLSLCVAVDKTVVLLGSGRRL